LQGHFFKTWTPVVVFFGGTKARVTTRRSQSKVETPMKPTCICLIASLAVYGTARATLANTFASATSFAVAAQNNPPNTPVTFSQSFNDEDVSLASAASAAVAVNTIGASTIGFASATYGDISMVGDADVNGGLDQLESGGEAQTTLKGGWEDRIVITVPFLPGGDTIKIHGLLDMTGGFTRDKATGPISGPGFSTGATISGNLSISTFNSPGSANFGPGCACVSRILSTVNPTDISIIDISNTFVDWGIPNGIGSTVTVSATLFVKATAGASAEASITGFFGGSIHWGGIESVRNAATGELLTDWTVTSESGFDYSKPFVPEPSSSVLLAFVLCGWLGHGRPRRQRS
jgi:hypothetical protein